MAESRLLLLLRILRRGQGEGRSQLVVHRVSTMTPLGKVSFLPPPPPPPLPGMLELVLHLLNGGAMLLQRRVGLQPGYQRASLFRCKVLQGIIPSAFPPI